MYIREYPVRSALIATGVAAAYGFASGILVWDPNQNKPLYDPYKIAEMTQGAKANFDGLKARVGAANPNVAVAGPQDSRSTYPLADAATTTAVAGRIKASPTSIHCPTPDQTDYRVPFTGEESDPDAQLCLRTNTLKVAQAAGSATIIFEMSVSDSYARKNTADFLPNSLAGLEESDCEAITGRLEAYGGYLAVQVGQLSPTLSVPVAVVADHETRRNCDTWPRDFLSEKSDRVG